MELVVKNRRKTNYAVHHGYDEGSDGLHAWTARKGPQNEHYAFAHSEINAYRRKIDAINIRLKIRNDPDALPLPPLEVWASQMRSR